MASRLGMFDRTFARLTGEGPRPERIMIDATHLKASHIAGSLHFAGEVDAFNSIQQIAAQTAASGNGQPLRQVRRMNRCTGNSPSLLVPIRRRLVYLLKLD